MLHLLPVRTAAAAENMALDFLLLQRYPHAAAARFRHYEWRAPAFTFGYSQKIAFVRANLPPGEHFDLCRRPTGGGIVDHRNDWTYALVLPRGQALYDERAAQSYRVVHECLAAALTGLGCPAEVKRECDPAEGGDCGPGVCFQKAELYDVIQPATGAKIAGAAQKRNKHGLLFQGSIEKAAVGAIDWDVFQAKFAANLAGALAVPAGETPWPELNEDEVAGLVEQYSSPEWIEYR
ncbi:MAG TPA: lipoate--protein ligase family protein [Lacunisphaera sp.]|nr:lipoate--protein ligase family protein [Lacunisphaera sp.]